MSKPKVLHLKRESIHGIPAYGAYIGNVLMGHVVRQSMGDKWGVVRLGSDDFDPIEYWYESRKDALVGLIATK